MELVRKLEEIERSLWTNDAHVYDATLLNEAWLIFAETGPIAKRAALDAIAGENAEGRRWSYVKFSEVRLLRAAEETAVLMYLARARWEGRSETHSIHCGSVYVLRGHEWKLAFHQQTPA